MHLGANKILATDMLRYWVCENNIEKAFVSSNGNYHTVNIQLTPSATKEFSKLTKKNIGGRLEILVKNDIKNNIIVDTTIMDSIESGQIFIKFMYEKDANKFIKDIIENAPDQPCGVRNKSEMLYSYEFEEYMHEKSISFHASRLAYPDAPGMVLALTDRDSGTNVEVTTDGRHLFATTVNGDKLWRVDVIEAIRDQGHFVDTPVIRNISFSSKGKIFATVGQHTGAEIELASGVVRWWGSN